MALFEGYERRIGKVEGVLKEYGIASLEEAEKICSEAGISPYQIAKDVQPICFEDAGWAYTAGCAIAIRKNVETAAEAAEAIGLGLQSFTVPGSVADDRKVGIGHGNWAPCCSGTRQNVSPSWRDTKVSQRRKAPSALSIMRTRPGKSRFGSS